MRGLQIAVFAALFIYTACAAPSISKRTSLPPQGPPGSLRPRGLFGSCFGRKGKSTQDNKQTGEVNVDGVCCNHGPDSVQHAWDNRGQMISREDTVNQVYLLTNKFKGQVAVIKAIPAYNDAIHKKVIEEETNLELVDQSLGFAVKRDPERFAIDISPKARVPKIQKKGPFTTYFIVMPYLGVPERQLLDISNIKILQREAVKRYDKIYGMRRDKCGPKDFVYDFRDDPGTGRRALDKAAIDDWTYATAVSEKARTAKAKLKPIPEEFCSHEVPPSHDPKTTSGQDS